MRQNAAYTKYTIQYKATLDNVYWKAFTVKKALLAKRAVVMFITCKRLRFFASQNYS